MADSSNTARNFLLTGVLLGVGAAAAGAYIMTSEEIPNIDPRVEGSGKTAALTQEAAQLKEQALAPRQMADVAPQGAEVPRIAAENGSVPRYTPLFFAPKLWHISEGPAAGVRDLMHSKSPNLHADVPNTEFFKYGLEEIIGNPNALDLDSDGDGFTNREEFAAATNPNDSRSMPPFVATDGSGVKMVWARVNIDRHSLVLGSSYPYTGDIDISVHDWVNGAMRPVRSSQLKGLKEGDTFGFGEADSGALSKTRFKIVGLGEDAAKGKYIDIEDSYTKVEANKRFKLFPGVKPDSRGDISDVAVLFRMSAGSSKDQTLPAVQLGETFAVPGFDGVTCTLSKATPKSVDIRIEGVEKPIKVEKAPSQAKK